MSRLMRLSAKLVKSFPRVSGDEPCDAHPSRAVSTFSPRERG